MVKTIPEGYTALTPCFTYKDSRKAMEFYKKAFGAIERFVFPTPDGKGVSHAEMMIGNSVIMMGDEMPEMGNKSAESLGASPISFYVYVLDVDAAFKKATTAGATVKMPLMDMFWGDRAGVVVDPFGYSWMLATHTKDMSDAEIGKAAQQFYAQQSK